MPKWWPVCTIESHSELTQLLDAMDAADNTSNTKTTKQTLTIHANGELSAIPRERLTGTMPTGNTCEILLTNIIGIPNKDCLPVSIFANKAVFRCVECNVDDWPHVEAVGPHANELTAGGVQPNHGNTSVGKAEHNDIRAVIYRIFVYGQSATGVFYED